MRKKEEKIAHQPIRVLRERTRRKREREKNECIPQQSISIDIVKLKIVRTKENFTEKKERKEDDNVRERK